MDNQQEIEIMKRFIINTYFKQKYGNVSVLNLSLKYKDKNLLRILGLPKRFYRKYELVLIDEEEKKLVHKHVPFNEKDSVKFFLEKIYPKKNA